MDRLGMWQFLAVARVLPVLTLALGLPSLQAFAAEFVVRSYGEGSDIFPGDGVAEVQPGTGITTLHAAIEEANAFPGHDVIRIQLDSNIDCMCLNGGPCKVRPEYTRPLPALTDPDGTTIDASGVSWFSGARQNADLGEPGFNAALVLLSSNNVIRNMVLWNYPQDGIVISGPNADGNIIERCSIGFACPGVNGVGRHGILIDAGEESVAGMGPSTNVIRGNEIGDSGGYGIVLKGTGADGNFVVGNALGQPLRDRTEICGVHVDEITEPTLVVPDPNILGCTLEKIEQFHDAYRLPSYDPNNFGNILVQDGASGNVIGGAGLENANFIGGEIWRSRYTISESSGPLCSETVFRTLGSDTGIVLEGEGTMGNKIWGNYIGYRNVAVFEEVEGGHRMHPRRDMNGTSGEGIVIRDGASGNTVGDIDDPALGNRIRYIFRDAIVVSGPQTSGNAIFNNELGSEENGITIEDNAHDVMIGAVDAGNFINARQYGIEIKGMSTNIQLLGNHLYHNGFSGLAVHDGSFGNTIGGAATGEGNRFEGNCNDGVIFFDPGTAQNLFLGNEVFGNGEIGVFLVNGASSNTIGGSSAGAGNRIFNNAVTGVEIHDVPSTGNEILGNEIFGNGTRGVFLVDGTSGNVIGGVESPKRNRVYNNGLSGIEINGAETVENSIRINAIYDNEEKGILLSFGSNEGIQPPVIERFVPFSGTAPPGSFVDVFSDEAEEGQRYIDTVVADGEGNFTKSLNLFPYRNTNLTATATDINGNTSEFSLPLSIIAPTFAETPADRVIVEGDDFALAVAVEGSPELTVQWRFRPDGGNFILLENNTTFSGVDTMTLMVANGQPPQEGFYQCVADNGLGAVNSREIFVRVVPEDINDLQVNTLSDTNDGVTSSFGRLLAEPGADGVVSLREAIAAANAMEGANVIRFSVEGTIAVESALPAISDTTGGLTLDGGEVLSLDGSALTGTESGLTVTSGGNHIAGLGLFHFPASGLTLSGTDATENTVVACRVGIDGSEAKANGASGIVLRDGASSNTIGGSLEDDGNHIGYHSETGITLTGPETTLNVVQGNTITANSLAGVFLTEMAADNLIGGDNADAGNTVAENTGIGVYVSGTGTARNTIRHNRIRANGDLGIRLFDGGNAGIARPVVQSIDPIAGTAPANSTVDFFLAVDDEGETFLMTLVADAEGSFAAPVMDLSEHDGHHLTATATSPDGNTSAFSAPVNIDFTNPVLVLNGNASAMVECGVSYEDPGATATDNLDGDLTEAVVATLLDGGGNPAGSIEEAAPGSYTLRYTVSDTSGLAASPISRVVTIVDTVAPDVVMLGESMVEVGCGSTWEDPGATALDACEGAVAVSVSGEVDVARAGEYTLTYRAEDNAGNRSGTLTRTVVVLDAEAPVVSLLGESTVSLECGEPYVEPGSTALDGCQGELPVTRTGTVDVGRAGLYVLSYNAIDGAGNRAETVTRTVVVDDRTAPVLMLNGDAEVTITCGQGYAELGATLFDACNPGADVVVSGNLDTNTAGIYTLLYDATDDAGNVATTVMRTVTVLGGSAPVVAVSGEATVTVPCDSVYQDAGARAVDGCQTDITEFIEVDNPVDTGQPGTYTVTYTVEDGVGTAAEPATRTVIVLSCAAPCDNQCNGAANDAIDEDGDGLSACKESCVGTSDRNPDSDGDGMADGFEYEHRLNPTVDDGNQDADLDGTSNLDEYLEQGMPRNEDSPFRTFFVSPNGLDQPEAGTRENPWRTVAYALARVNPTEQAPVRIFLDAGIYVEDVAVKAHAELRNAIGADVELMGTTLLRANATVQGITLTSDAMETGIVFLEGSARVRDCTINGEFGENLAGAVVEPGSTPGSVFEGCLFQNLVTAIDVSGALPAVRQCVFADIGTSAIVVRSGASIGPADTEMGQGLNGWNDFSALGDGLAIMNETSAALSAQWNDWGTDSITVRQSLVEGVVNQGNALAVGGAAMSVSLEVVVTEGTNQNRISGAAVALSGQSTINATTGSDGRAQFSALPAGSWQVTVTAAGFPDASESASIQSGTRRVVNVVLLKDDTEPVPGPGPVDCTGPISGGNFSGDLILIGLLMACLAVGQLRRSGPVA